MPEKAGLGFGNPQNEKAEIGRALYTKEDGALDRREAPEGIAMSSRNPAVASVRKVPLWLWMRSSPVENSVMGGVNHLCTHVRARVVSRGCAGAG